MAFDFSAHVTVATDTHARRTAAPRLSKSCGGNGYFLKYTSETHGLQYVHVVSANGCRHSKQEQASEHRRRMGPSTA